MVARALTVGFPRMHKEAGERRDYLPDLVALTARSASRVVLEAGIGSGMGLSEQDYLSRDHRIEVGTNEEAFAQDIVVTLRSPEAGEFDKIRRGATLVAMLHFPTRPARIEALAEAGIRGVSLDGIVDDAGRRLVVNARAVAWNALEAAFDVLDRTWPMLWSPDREPVRVTVLGIGAIGRHAVEAASKLGSQERQDALLAAHLPGVMTLALGRNVTGDEHVMRSSFADTDVLVDASQRDDTSHPLVPNRWIAWLPEHAVICDCVVDPYLLDERPPTVRSVEGIPRGDLGHFVFEPDDPRWCDTIPAGVPSEYRRRVVSCYSWPGVHPRECMELYGTQLAPLLEVLIGRGGAGGIRGDGGYQERALHRACLATWLEHDPHVRHGARGPLGSSEPS